MILERHIDEKKPECIIKKVSADEPCVIRSFQEGLKTCYQDAITIKDIIAKLISEVLHNYGFCYELSSNEVNIST